jgi:hypothetical protein
VGHVAQVEEEPALLLAHASIKLSPVASTAAALLHLNEPRAHALLDDGSSSDKAGGWCLNNGATHHMTGQWEFFTELDSDVRGSVKFGDASGVEIKGVSAVIFTAESGEAARCGRAPDGGGSPERRGRAGGWVDGDRDLYIWRGSPSPDRYLGHHGIQASVRNVGPDGGWPTLTKANYVEWATVMRVRLQVRHIWEAVRYDNIDYYKDRRALDALIVEIPSEMQFSLSKKWTAKEIWNAIAVARIGSDRALKTTLQALRKEWENLAFRPGEDVDDFALRLNTLRQKMVQFSDDTYDEERAVELFRCIPEKYKQIACSIESLLDLSTMSIEEAIGRLKVVDGDEPQPLSGPITVSGKLHLTREQWEGCQGDGKKEESPPSTSGRKWHKSRGGAQAGARGRAEGSARGGAHNGTASNQMSA